MNVMQGEITLKKSIQVFTAGLLVLVLANSVEAAQLKLLLGGAVTESVRKIGAEFSHKTSHQIDLTSNTSGAVQKMLQSGTKADVIIVASSTMDALEKEHLIVPGTRFDVARGLIGVGIRPGAASPRQYPSGSGGRPCMFPTFRLISDRQKKSNAPPEGSS